MLYAGPAFLHAQLIPLYRLPVFLAGRVRASRLNFSRRRLQVNEWFLDKVALIFSTAAINNSIEQAE